MRIKVTGSNGFVGTMLCKVLNIPNEDRFDILDANNPQDVKKEVVQSQICDGADVIVHLAAISGIKACNDNKTFAYDTNTKMTIELAERASKSSVKRFIFASSSAVYGEAQQYNMNELHPTEPRSVYGENKLEAEKAIWKLNSKDFKVVILRKSNLYGYGMKNKGITVIDKFIESYISKKPIQISGNGSQKRDFIHVIDAVNLYTKIANATKCRSGVYNVGGYEPLSVRTIAELVNDYGEKLIGYRVPIEFVPNQSENLSHDFRYDWSKARMEFNYTPFLTLDDFLKEKFMSELRK